MKFKVGDKVKFIGWKTALFDVPAVQVGEIGIVESVKQKQQIGCDYWVKFPERDNARFAFDERELALVDELPALSKTFTWILSWFYADSDADYTRYGSHRK